jgi:hypothetical protein|tara:strand:- start:11 stop:460 length:450 start_codon:yes stop_codon:yes gene_type:complete
MLQLDFFDKLLPNELIPEHLTKRECYVYVMEDRHNKKTVHKIGLSNNPHRRLKEIWNNGWGLKIVDVMVFDNRRIAMRIEKLAHAIADKMYNHAWRYGNGGTEFFTVTRNQAMQLVRKAFIIFESLGKDLEALIAYTKEVRKGKITVTL